MVMTLHLHSSLLALRIELHETHTSSQIPLRNSACYRVQLFHGKPSIIGGGNYCTVLDALILLLLIVHHTRGHGKPAIEPASDEACISFYRTHMFFSSCSICMF